LRANGSRERAPGDTLREAIHLAAKQVWIASSLLLLAMTNSTRLICSPWQIKFVHSGCGKLTRRANHFWFSEIVSSPEIKNIPLLPPGKSALGLPPSRAHKRGASRSSRTLGAGCGGRGSVRRAQMRAGRMMLMRTAKSCGSDAPMLASSLREVAQATVSNKPGHRGEREVSRKTIAQGRPGLLR
jgi:hypothetical protein